ncbi:MAG: hypothetical protein ACR2OX_07435, partial [Methyloligellaceae bacterium]
MSDRTSHGTALFTQLRFAALRSTIQSFWIFAFALLAMDIAWLSLGGFSVAPVTAALVAAIALAIFALGYFYTVHRPVPEFQACVFGIAFILVYTNALALCSYLLTSLAMPLHDEFFSRMDVVLGFDWVAWLQWMNAHPFIGNTLTFAYRSSMIQVFAVI